VLTEILNHRINDGDQAIANWMIEIFWAMIKFFWGNDEKHFLGQML
jgi:hypothetical protein